MASDRGQKCWFSRELVIRVQNLPPRSNRANILQASTLGMITTENIHKICFLIFWTHLPSIFRTTHSILEWFVHQKTSNCLEELNAFLGWKIWDRVGIAMVNKRIEAICMKNSRFRDIHNTAKITPIWSDLEWAHYTTYRYHERGGWIESSCSVAPEHAFWPQT